MRARLRLGAFVVAGLVLAVTLAFVVSPSASGSPDGLNRVAADHGLSAEQRPHALRRLPTAGYGVRGIDDRRLSTGLAGVLGVAVTFAAAGGVALVAKRRRPPA
jgi:cobalt/nickel transport system permease protein